jgi:predicted acyl esterase
MRCLCLLAFVTTLAAADLPPLDLGGVREQHIRIPMRDGASLSAYLYLPAGEGPWPAVFEQRYADISGKSTRQRSAELATRGFAVAMVNFRGTHLSEGRWQGYRALGWGELQDGYDTCEWLAVQPWCTGKVGTFGSSQGGFAQNFLAVTKPPHLVCQYMVDTGLSLFQEGYRIGGGTKPQRFIAMRNFCREPADNDALLAEWEQHPNYDAYWQAEDCSRHFDRMDVPCFTIGSWYDFMVQGSIDSFIGRQHQGGPGSRGRQQLLLGPWLHGRLNKGSKVGEMLYPDNATWPELDHLTRWFNHWLKGEANEVETEPAVRYYVMGAVGEPGAPGNVWREAADWPPPVNEQSLFLHAEGRLDSVQPGEQGGATHYLSDPRQPMEIPARGFPGARDASGFESQAEVRTWTSEPLTEPVEWTGAVHAEIWLSSTAPDTDVIVRVSDVYPDGRSMLVMDYPQRARYREGFDRQVLLTPGEPAKLKWRIGWTSLIFNKGHRIRVTVASTGAPYYEPNSQTGGPQTREWLQDARAATNTIWHDAVRPSRLIVPRPVHP